MYATPEALVEYIALAPAVSNNALAPAVYVTPAPVFEYIVPAPVVERVEPAPAVSYAALAPAEYVTPAPVFEHITPAPVVERIESAPAVSAALAPAEYVTPAPSVKYCQDQRGPESAPTFVYCRAAAFPQPQKGLPPWKIQGEVTTPSSFNERATSAAHLAAGKSQFRAKMCVPPAHLPNALLGVGSRWPAAGAANVSDVPVIRGQKLH